MAKQHEKTFGGALGFAKDSSVTFYMNEPKRWLMKMKPGTRVLVTVEWTEDAKPKSSP